MEVDVEKMRDVYDKMGNAKDVLGIVSESWDDAQLSFDMSGIYAEPSEKMRLFFWISTKRMSAWGLKLLVISAVEVIAVTFAWSIDAPLLIKACLAIASPLFAERKVEELMNDAE